MSCVTGHGFLVPSPDGKSLVIGDRAEITDKGREALAEESEAMRFLRRRTELSGRLSLIEQAYWVRASHPDESSSAQPHRFKAAD